MYMYLSLSHMVLQFSYIYVYVIRFLTNMVQHFSGFCATHRKIALTFMILWIILATKISHLYVNTSCSYPCGTVFHCLS